MARRRSYPPLDVYLNSRLVGQMRRESSGAVEFQYAPEWLGWEHTFPVSLSLPIRKEVYSGAPVLAVFENLLPDNIAIRRRIATNAHADGVDAYSLLSVIGHDCVGALQFLQPGVEPGPAGSSDGIEINDEQVAEIIANLATAPLGLSADDTFRISLAGAQEKTALLYRNGRWFKPIGTAATTHIFKPSIGRLPNGIDLTHSVENEYLCLKLIEALGLPAAQASMAQFGDRPVLIVERFDRLWDREGRLLRRPQEDCCQALGVQPIIKYESEGGPGIEGILKLLRDGDMPAEDQRNFMKSMVIFWLLGATDGHAKNFSIFLSPGGRYQMTPLYDVISTQPSVTLGHLPQGQFKLAMAVGNKRHYRVNTIQARHFVETAERGGMGAKIVASIFEELREITKGAVEGTVAQLPRDFPEDIVQSIKLGIRQRIQFLS